LKNGKAQYLAKQLVIGKIEGQNRVLRKHGLDVKENVVKVVEFIRYDDLKSLSRKLKGLEGKYGEHYFNQIFTLFPKKLRPRRRSKFKAYDGINNTFNLAYMLLFWKCYRALVKAHLEPYLGFLHNMQYGRPSLVCDFVELYRHLVDDFLIGYCQKLKPRDFKAKTDNMGFKGKKKGKRIYLKKSLTDDLTDKLQDYFRRTVKIPRMKVGKKQELETLIDEEALLLGKYLRDERKSWIPRIAVP